MLHESQCLFSLVLGLTENHEVVGITHEPKTGMVHLPIQVVQNNVGQEWGNDSTLWRANGSGFEDSIVHHPRGEKFFDKPENVAIGTGSGNRLHNDLLREVVKESTNVGVHNNMEAFVMELENRLQSHMAVASLAEAEGRRMEQGFEDRVQEAANHLLGDPIADCWNAEGAKLRLIFRDEVASERVWLKRTLFQIPHQRPEIIGKVGLKHLDADLVDARGPTIALDGFKAFKHQSVGDTSRQGVGFDDLGHKKSPVTIQPNAPPHPLLGMFLSLNR